jgi:hypothetical protein
MIQRFSIGASAVAFLAFAQPGWSLTAEEAWTNWQTLSESFGQTITATSEAKSGNELTVTGMSSAMSVEEGTVSGTVDQIVFTENGDGTVTITMSPEYMMNLDMRPEYGEVVEAVFKFTQEGMRITASDAGGGASFVFSVPEMKFSTEKLEVDGVGDFADVSGTIASMNGQYTAGPTTPPTVTSSFSSGAVQMDIKVRDPEEGGTFNASVSMANLSSNSTGTGAVLLGMSADFPAMLAQGFSSQGNVVYGPTTFSMDFEDDSENFAMDGASDGGSAVVSIDKDAISYNVSYNALNVGLSGSDIPLPRIDVAFGEMGLNVLMPLAQSDDPKPFVFRLGMNDFSLGDPVWNLFDPAAILPRDPATLIVDLAGQGNWLVDILDPERASALMPGQVHALSISEILLDLAGAQVKADGGFTFDNNDLTTFNGFPRPQGSANITLTGANALLDKLVQMGLLPSDQAAGVRMMSGLLLRPGGGEDTLLSEITITPDGKILANGAPLPF